MADERDVDVEAGGQKKPDIMPKLPQSLTLEEKKYLLAIERGDMANVRRMLQRAKQKRTFDVNCVDSLGRGALTIAIDQEHLEMVELLIVMGIDTKDALLHAINVEFVEAVELLLEHEELIHKEGEPYSWQKVDLATASFTPDITPLILAAHRNNYEILKILLDRGATVPMPHDIKCGCEECIKESEEDSLRHSLSRLNEYKALASPSLIALSSSDPILTAFQLSWELRNLAFAEPECKSEYMELRRQCQQFAVDLLHQSRSSQELAMILNHDPESPPYNEGEHMKLARLELAIVYKQKKFVAHPNIQQLLASLWYEGVPGFRRKSAAQKMVIIVKVALLFPFYCMLYMIAPNTKTGKLMRKPFMKFLIHASSYLFFLLVLILVSLRAEEVVIELFGTDDMRQNLIERSSRQRGNPPTILEYVVLLYVAGFIYEETQEMFTEGIKSYLKNMWNFIDFSRNFLYTGVFVLRLVAYIQQTSEINADPSVAYVRREEWNPFDPQLIAEGLFAGANIFSALKLVHLFSINPHLGPLQISLGRMVIDIVKFFFIYTLVLFAFACGLNQLLWYFSDLEKKKCYHLPNGEPDFDGAGDACMKWRRFANVFESSQSLFWASFGMVDLSSFELTGIKTYTRFWGLLMFGSYSVINVIVLLNLLIAMMSNSYAMIDEHSDTEWKFARTKLWMSYFEESCTLPPPFNIFPRPKHLLKLCGVRKTDKLRRMSTKRRNFEERERDYRYTAIMRALVWRYVSAMHRKMEENPVTEDDINELKSEISAFRYELLEVLYKNGLDTSSAEKKEKAILGKKMKIWERRLMKDFQVAPVTTEEDEALLFQPPPENEDSLSRSQIGRCHNRDSFKKQQNLQKAIEEAKKLVEKSPIASRAVTPIELPDVTGSNIMDIIKGVDAGNGSQNHFLTPSPRPIHAANITVSIQPPPKKEKSKRSPPPKPAEAITTQPTDLINLGSQKNSPVTERTPVSESSSSELSSKPNLAAEVVKEESAPQSKPSEVILSPSSSKDTKTDSRDCSICSKDYTNTECPAEATSTDHSLFDSHGSSEQKLNCRSPEICVTLAPHQGQEDRFDELEEGKIVEEISKIFSAEGITSLSPEESPESGRMSPIAKELFAEGAPSSEKQEMGAERIEETEACKDDTKLSEESQETENVAVTSRVVSPDVKITEKTSTPVARKKKVRLDIPDTKKEDNEAVKSPLSERNIQRINKSPYRQPKTGWL